MRFILFRAQLFQAEAPSAQQRSQKKQALLTFETGIRPHIHALLPSYDVHLRDSHGHTALQLLLPLLCPASPKGWTYEVVEALLKGGADPNERDDSGCPPIVRWASQHPPSACGLLLLLQYGADRNATDGQRDTLLHKLVRNEDAAVLLELYEEGMEGVDYFQRNDEGVTAAEMAVQRQTHAASHSSSSSARDIAALLTAQLLLWEQRERPLLRRMLSEWMIPELAEEVLAYLDGETSRQEQSEQAAGGADESSSASRTDE
jgi:hypothetical protein